MRDRHSDIAFIGSWLEGPLHIHTLYQPANMVEENPARTLRCAFLDGLYCRPGDRYNVAPRGHSYQLAIALLAHDLHVAVMRHYPPPRLDTTAHIKDALIATSYANVVANLHPLPL